MLRLHSLCDDAAGIGRQAAGVLTAIGVVIFVYQPGEVEQWLERQCGVTEKKNMAELFGADRDVVMLLAGSGSIAILIILATMS